MQKGEWQIKHNIISMNKNKNNINKELISRRNFFRKSVHKILPILTLLTLQSPLFSMAQKVYSETSCKYSCKTGCSNECNTQCTKTCAATCKNICGGNCEGTCRNTGKCDYCSDSCKNNCTRSCKNTCQSLSKGKDTLKFKW